MNTTATERLIQPSQPSGETKRIDAASPTRVCLICGSARHRTAFNEFGIEILRCQDCGHVFSSYSAEPHYDGFWGDDVPDVEHFYWKNARVRMHRDFSRRFLTGRSGKLLDMGCGLGFFVDYVGQFEGWQAFGCELSPAAVRYARTKLGLRNIIGGRLDEVDLPENSFDIITMWDVLDHLAQPDRVLRRCYELLKPGGVCFIRTPNLPVQLARARIKKAVWGDRPGISYLLARDHCHYYSERSVTKLLVRNGFSSVDFTHLHPIGALTRRADAFVRLVKQMSFQVVRGLHVISGRRINLDNLFVVAKKLEESDSRL